MIDVFNAIVCNSIKAAFNDYEVVTDDGHGWLTPGKRSWDGSFRENEFNSSIEAKLLLLLDQCGIRTHQLASGWEDEALNKRSSLENEIATQAELKKRRILGVSIHADAWLQDRSANGFCVYYYQKDSVYSREGKRLARTVADAIMDSDKRNGHIILPRHENGICGANFHILRETDGTWILIENAFMTHDKDLEYLKSDTFRNHRAQAMLDGLYYYAIS